MIYWLRVWKFLVDNGDVDSLTEMCKNSDMSYMTILTGIRMLENVNLISVVETGRNKTVVRTQKFFDTLDNFNELYDATK